MLLIDAQAQMQHTRNTAFGDDHIINGMPQEFLLAFPAHETCQQQAMFDIIIAVQYFLQLCLKFLQFNISHEPECTDIDAANRYRTMPIAATHPKQGTIAAYAERDISWLFLYPLRSIVCKAEEICFPGRQHQTYLFALEKSKQTAQDFRRFRLVQVRKNSNLQQRSQLLISSFIQFPMGGSYS